VLDLLEGTAARTTAAHLFDNSLVAWAYDRARVLLLRVFGLPRFAKEVAGIQEWLQVGPGATVLDLACGQGNFTVEWARRAGPDGLVLGVDVSAPMLARAVARVRAQGLDNVLLIRGDAHHLPFASRCLDRVNCSGGFHLIPDLPHALAEIARVTAPGGVLTASTFAEGPADRRAGLKRWLERRLGMHFVPLEWLGERLAAVGFHDYRWTLPGGWFGYTSARKDGAP
jgi:ubiquinone/menaquinone biosynthesis C-methylase UbiE